MKILHGELLSVDNADLDEKMSFSVPSSVTTIQAGAFVNASKIKKICIPDSVDLILTDAFLGCKYLIEINIPNNCLSFNMDQFNCKNLSIINIDSKISNVDFSMNKLINSRKIKKINFIYDDKVYTVVKNKEYDVKKVDGDTFVLDNKNFDDCVIITTNGIKKCNRSDLIPFINCDNFQVFERAYSNIFAKNINLFYKWIDIINGIRGNSFNHFPSETIMLSIPANKKSAMEYILRNKAWRKLENDICSYTGKSLIGYMKFCYAIGLFAGNNSDHEKAIKFLYKIKREDVDLGQIVLTFYKTDINTIGYNKDYANFMFEEIKSSQLHKLYDDEEIGPELYLQFSKLVTYLKEHGESINIENAVDYLKAHCYKTRKGNEDLFNEFKKYSMEYSSSDYNIMQDLYEKAKEIAKYNSKKIVATKDYEDEYYYKWLQPNDPANFLLGDKVGCCARINDVGDGILRASITDDEVRNLAFFKKNKKIIGKATAYYNKSEKYILFNNAEISSSVKDEEKERILKALKRAVKDQVEGLLDDGIELKEIAMGMLRNDLEEQIKNSNIKIKYSNLLNNYHFMSYFCGSLEEYDGDANDVHKGQCILWESDKNYQKQLLEKFGFKVRKR